MSPVSWTCAPASVVEQACVAGDVVAVVVEMAELTFMDCCGYAGLVAARRVLQEHGGSLTLRHEVGQPARLLAMLGAEDARTRGGDERRDESVSIGRGL